MKHGTARRGITLKGCGHRDVSDVDRRTIYEHLPYVRIEDARLTGDARSQAAASFEKLKLAPALGPYKLAEKSAIWSRVYHALRRASFVNGCVIYDRCYHKTSKIQLQVIDAATELGFVRNVRSRPGSPKCSRLLPLPPLKREFIQDPWEFDAERLTRFAFLTRRGDRTELEFATTDPIPANIQRRLERVNAVNSACNITFSPFDEWSDRHLGARRLRLIHYARFTNDWGHHGRLYTRRYGHQSLRSNERQTISFNGLPSVEFDYSAMHPRMVYHRKRVDVDGGEKVERPAAGKSERYCRGMTESECGERLGRTGCLS